MATTGRTEARTKAWLLLPLLAVFAVLAFPATASAANTIVVDTTADNTPTGCSLRAAILAASTDHTQAGCTSGAPGADTIQVPAGTYDLSANFGQLVVSSDMNIIGAGARPTDIRGYALGSRLLEISAGTVTIRGFTIEGGNETNGSPLPNPGVGGGIWIDNPGSLTLQDSMVLGNHADQSGGGIANDGTLAVIGSTIEHNTAGCGVISCGFGVGGGIDDFGANLAVTNSTIMDNQAQSDGGGLYLDSGASFTNATIANNEADLGQTGEVGGGGIAVAFGVTQTVSLTNTLLAANPWNGDDWNCTTGVTSLGGNLADDSTCGLGAGEQGGVDPKLGQILGTGPTDLLPLTPGSPAIDAANDLACPPTDQRGVSRPQGPRCDIGAYEAQPGTIAFESNRVGGISQIWAMGPDGSNAVQLTHDASGVTDTLPSISPDGHTIVYQSDASGFNQIWAINGDGSNPRQLTSGGTNDQPTFSPDGKKIAFDSDRDGYFQLFVMNADGSGQTQVMTTDGAVGGSSWSPDGSQIAFNEDTNGTNQIYTVDAATGTITGPLTSAGGNTNPHWSPDGSEILFVSSRCDPALGSLAEPPLCGGGESVFLMNADGTNQHNLTQANIFDADPAWSPDGSHIAFVRDLGGQAFNVFTANADGTNQVRLTLEGQRNSFPNWGTQVSAPNELSNLSVSVTPSNAGAGIDRVPISNQNIPDAWLSFLAGSTTSAPVGSTPVGSTPVGSTPVGSTPVGSTPVGSTPVGSTPVGSTPVGSTPVGSTGLFDLPVGSTPVGSTALSSVLLSQIQLHNASWDQILCGSLLNKPLAAITLEDVKESSETCSDRNTSLQHLEALTLRQVDLTTTLLRSVHWSTLLMGNTKLSALPGGFEAWCGTDGQIPADGGSCANATGDTTVLQMDVAGQLGSAPVGSTPVGSTPVGSTPVGSTPVGSTDVAASRLANIPLSDINPLTPVVNCLGNGGTFDCTGKTLGDAYRASAILPAAKFSDIAAAMAANGITINDLVVAIIGAAGFPWEQLPIQGLQPYSATHSTVTYTVSNNVDCSSAPQFTITAHLPKGFFPVDGTVQFAQFAVGNHPLQPAGTPHVVGADAAAAAKNNAYQWTLHCPGGDTSLEAATLKFDAWVGLSLGTFTTHVTASTAITSIGTTGAPVTVHQNPEASDPSSATEIQPDTLVAGHIAFSGEQAFYKVKLDGLPRGTKIAAFVNVPSGADLDLTMSAPAAPSFFSTPVGSTPVGSTPIEDSGVGFSANGLALPPDTLQDVPVGSTPVGSTPVGSTPVGSTSANRGTGVNEAGGIITTGQGGFATIGVSGYNGATSNQPFVLRVQETPPPTLPACPARNLTVSSANQGTLPSSLPTSTKTLFIVDKQRLTAMYPNTVSSMLAALNTLASRSEVSGTVLFVDGDPGVRSAYSAWDATPCDTTARNDVVKAINDVVASYRNSATGLPSLHYVVLVGSDEATPMADAPDPVFLSPEENEAADLAFTTNGLTHGNALYASAAQNYILTDGAYGAFTNIPWLGRNLLLPQISVSRLVETPSDIVGQINRYLGNNGLSAPQSAAGTLQPSTALVTGYDFLADGAQAVHDNLKANFSALTTTENLASGAPSIDNPGTAWKASTAYNAGAIVHPISPSGLSFKAQTSGMSGSFEPSWPLAPVGTIPDNGITWVPIIPWNANDVLSSAIAATNAPSIVSVDAHYNQYELEAANGDLASGPASANLGLAARILFTMGCHGGLNVSDTLPGGTSPPASKFLDWPELYARDQAAMYIANTGYGYGDSESVALSERLLSLFAKNLHSDSGSVGEEWVNALQQYFATAGAYDVYDEKVMEETTFYGLPFWHFDPPGSGSSFTPLTTTADPITGTQSATITFPGTGATTQSQFGLYRPNLPITSRQVTSSLPARGAWIKGLSSTETSTDAIIGYPTIDQSSHEPAPNVAPIFFPASPFTLEHSLAFGTERDYLNVSDQFRPTGSGDAGVQRHFTNPSTFEIFYSQSADQVAPLISQVNVSTSGGVATITARATDDSGHLAEVAALVNDTQWHYLQLTQSTQDPTVWSGTINVSVDPEVFVEATDGVNVAYSANKGLNFTSTNSSPPDGVQILVQAPVGPYALNQLVNATYQCGSAASQCLGTVPSGSSINTSTFGVHTFVVQALDSDGSVIGSVQRTYVVQYPFNGFFSPVDNEPVLNVVKAGSAIPVVFSLSGNQGLDIFASGYPKSQMIACDASAPADGIESTVTAGGSSLSYDSSSGRYTYVWKTDKSWSGCRALILKTKDGVTHRADFKFK